MRKYLIALGSFLAAAALLAPTVLAQIFGLGNFDVTRLVWTFGIIFIVIMVISGYLMAYATKMGVNSGFAKAAIGLFTISFFILILFMLYPSKLPEQLKDLIGALFVLSIFALGAQALVARTSSYYAHNPEVAHAAEMRASGSREARREGKTEMQLLGDTHQMKDTLLTLGKLGLTAASNPAAMRAMKKKLGKFGFLVPEALISARELLFAIYKEAETNEKLKEGVDKIDEVSAIMFSQAASAGEIHNIKLLRKEEVENMVQHMRENVKLEEQQVLMLEERLKQYEKEWVTATTMKDFSAVPHSTRQDLESYTKEIEVFLLEARKMIDEQKKEIEEAKNKGRKRIRQNKNEIEKADAEATEE